MRPKRDPVPRARDAWVWLGGLALLGFLGAGVTAAGVALWENIDIRLLVPQLAGPPPPLPAPIPATPAARDTRSFDAVLFNSPRNREYFPDENFHREALAAWRQLIEEMGGTVREVADAAGLRGVGTDALLAVVESPCLTSVEIDAVRAHLTAGGGVLANWAVGVRDGACEWVGWQTVAALTGAEDVREIPTREGLFLTIPGGVALSPGFDPGTRVELRPDPSLALRVRGPRVYWSDWALNPAPDESGGGADVAAVATRSPLGGRITWLGLRLRQGVTPADSAGLARLARNGIAWAAGVASASPHAWPDSRRAALLFTLDVEDEPQNAVHTAAFLRERDLPGTFFVVSHLVVEDQELAEVLSSAGEVGSQTTDHTPLQGLTAQDQRLRLRRSAEEIERWTGSGPRGLHPPEETFDAHTLDAWQRVGGTYLLGGNEARSASPEIHRGDETVQVLIPRILKDDYNIIVQDRVLRATSLGQAFLSGARKMRALGGVAVVAGHTQIMREGARTSAVAAVADSALAQGDWWITTGAEVAAWWTARAETTVGFERTPTAALDSSSTGSASVGSDHDIVSDLVVSAPPGRAIAGLWLDVVIPTAPENLVPLVDGRSVDFEVTEWGLRVPVGDLAEGQSRRVSFLVLEEEDEATGLRR